MSNELKLGHSPLTGKIYLGAQNRNVWSGKKRDVTSDFIKVMLQKFEPNSTCTLTMTGESTYRIIVVDIDKEVSVDGKIIK